MSDAPTQPVEHIACPPQWASGQADSVAVTIFNPLNKTLDYRIDFQYYTDSHYPSYAGADTLSFSVPAQQRQIIALPEFKPSTTDLYQYAQVYAYSDDDLANPATFHNWLSSYQGHCGIRLENSPANRQLKQSSLFSLVGVLAGIGLIFAGSRGATRVRFLMAILLASGSLVIECLILLYVLRP